MKIINQSSEILGTPQSLEEAWKYVAMAARNCYQSEKVKQDESEEDFCRRVLLKGKDPTKMTKKEMEQFHLSPFEFGIVYLTIEGPWNVCEYSPTEKYINHPYSRVVGPIYSKDKYKEGERHYSKAYITTNLRVLIENHWEEDLKYACEPTKYHVKACCFHLITNRQVMAELTRHEAALSFTCESTRYCNYSKGKFDKQLTFIKPNWLNVESGEYEYDWDYVDGVSYWGWKDGKQLESRDKITDLYMTKLWDTENTYLQLINDYHETPQQAAIILVNDLKVSIMMCGYEDNLQHVFNLRAEECSGPVHPCMKELMQPLYKDYKYWISINDTDVC